MATKSSSSEDRKRALRHLNELIAALDRRVVHMERAGEAAIARDAAALRKKALKRIAELEKD
ncbi:MAG: hypothetical protein LAO77_17990 [Acidobacteriia bacterium]|nr:hypothetical protein [Terriglobia bacterium]